ncbi:MAG TPA: hypothetical protein VIJ40_03410 [Acidimicrobiales bacterium]
MSGSHGAPDSVALTSPASHLKLCGEGSECLRSVIWSSEFGTHKTARRLGSLPLTLVGDDKLMSSGEETVAWMAHDGQRAE